MKVLKQMACKNCEIYEVQINSIATIYSLKNVHICQKMNCQKLTDGFHDNFFVRFFSVFMKQNIRQLGEKRENIYERRPMWKATKYTKFILLKLIYQCLIFHAKRKSNRVQFFRKKCDVAFNCTSTGAIPQK